ncbi:MAG: DUF362 domain-containing protein [Myxococcales bacterium]|nr:DUF362 domain-containing protein [Myxococcales bacterium]
MKSDRSEAGMTRRTMILGGGAVAAAGAAAWVMRDKLRNKLDRLTILDSFFATPALLPHDPDKDRTSLFVARDAGPAANVDAVVSKLGGMSKIIGADDIVVIKVSAQWWNQGMTNVAAVRRVIEHVLEIPGFKGEVVVFENTHFHFPDKAIEDPARGLTRAFTRPSEINVDVPGWDKLGDLGPHFAKLGAPVSMVGLVDAGESMLSSSAWFDPDHQHGLYGGDNRGPIQAGEVRDGYFWDFEQTFRVKRSRVGYAQTPLSWPRFTSPKSGLVIDLRDGVFRREGQRLVGTGQKLRFLNMTTGNEHSSTGFTGATKSVMGIVDMSAGALGTHPLARGYQSVHYFGRTGRPNAEADPTWRMAGPLALWCQRVIKPDLYLTVAEWTAYIPKDGYDEKDDMRHHAKCRANTKTIVAGTDPVAIDAYCVRNLLMPLGSKSHAEHNLDDPDSKVSRFLRYYREVARAGTLDPALVTVA